MSRPCPSEHVLLAFHLGTLPDERVDDVAAHLEACGACETTSRAFDSMADPVLQALRSPSDGAPEWARWRTHSSSGRIGADLHPSRREAPEPESWPVLPGYEVIGYLGRGGIGVVYKAKDLRLGRLVALKMLRSDGERELRRSRLEAVALAHLQHPNIVQFHEMPEHEGRLYLAMELVEGEPLSEHLARPHPPRHAAQLVEFLARAVHHAHAHGIIHRDLKPANIMLAGVKSPPSGVRRRRRRRTPPGTRPRSWILGSPSDCRWIPRRRGRAT